MRLSIVGIISFKSLNLMTMRLLVLGGILFPVLSRFSQSLLHWVFLLLVALVVDAVYPRLRK